MRVLVTGANGFIGRPLVRCLVDSGDTVRAGVRRLDQDGPRPAKQVVVPNLGPDADWSPALDGVEAVVHLAARVHVMADVAADPLGEYRRVNVAGTLALAKQAAALGVRRFVFLSSVKVNGEATAGQAFKESDPPSPSDPYGVSKAEAEAGLLALGGTAGMEVVIIRPVLVYGPGVQANFLSMIRWIQRGVPLPLGSLTHNRRSLVGVDNLVDLVSVALRHPAAANEVFFAADGEDLSTADLLRRTATALGKTPRLIPVPAFLLAAGAMLVGRRSIWQRLGGNLQVDITKARSRLGWNPPTSVDEGLRRAVAPLIREGTP